MKQDGLESAAVPLFRQIGIVGLGLIGGSLARAFRLKAKIPVIVAVETDRAAGQSAVDDGTIDAYAHPDDGFSILDGSDLVLLCTPVSVITTILPALARLKIGILSDVSSVKVPVMREIDLPNFIGGHPMAGSERQGYACSNAALFENALYVLCAGESCRISIRELDAFEALIRSIGAYPVRMTAEEHDERVAVISHLPHVAASALSLLAASLDDGQLALLAAGGFRDITRIASSDASLWAGITRSATPTLLPVLAQYIDLLSAFSASLQTGDEFAVRDFFAQGAYYRNRLPVVGKGAMETTASLTVYLEDKPGSLAAITSLLGESDINIRNINIRNYRTYEGGQLHLLLSDSLQAAKAYSLLSEAGYECD